MATNTQTKYPQQANSGLAAAAGHADKTQCNTTPDILESDFLRTAV